MSATSPLNAEIESGSKVWLRHRDGSVLVTHARPGGKFESGHVPPLDREWIDRYGWHIEKIEPVPVSAARTVRELKAMHERASLGNDAEILRRAWEQIETLAALPGTDKENTA